MSDGQHRMPKKNEKVQSFYNYLKQVEGGIPEADSVTTHGSTYDRQQMTDLNASFQSSIDLNQPPSSPLGSSVSGVGDMETYSQISNPTSAAVHLYDDVRAKFRRMQGRMKRYEEKAKEMKEELNDYRTKESTVVQRVKEEERNHALSRQRELDDTVNKQLKMIEKMIREKSALADRVQHLNAEVKSIDSKYEVKISSLVEQQKQDMKRNREQWNSAEKIRRKKWMEEKKKEIKETTVRDLEPEIQRLLLEHKQEKAHIKVEFEEIMRMHRIRLSEQHERELREQQDRLQHEKDLTLEREHSNMQMQWQDQWNREQRDMQQIEHKLQLELTREKERSEQMLMEERRTNMEKQAKHKEELQVQERKHRDEVEELKAKMQHRHGEDIENIKSEWQIEKEEWQKNLISKFEMDLRDQKDQHMQHMQSQLEEQVDLVVSKMQGEILSVKNETSEKHKRHIEQLEKNHSQELHSAHEAIQMWRGRYESSVESNQSLDSQLDQHRAETQSVQEQYDNVRKEMASMRERMLQTQAHNDKQLRDQEQHWLNQIDLLHDERRKFRETIDRLKQDLQRTERDGRKQLSEQEERYKMDMDELIEASKTAIEKKDARIRELSERLQLAETRIKQTDLILAKQREELLQSTEQITDEDKSKRR